MSLNISFGNALTAGVLCLALAGCDSPSIAFSDVTARSVTIGPSTFAVRVKGDRAEAMRTSREFRPSKSAVMARSATAIQRVSGCVIATGGLTGDQAIQRAKLDCG